MFYVNFMSLRVIFRLSIVTCNKISISEIITLYQIFYSYHNGLRRQICRKKLDLQTDECDPQKSKLGEQNSIF